jgi:hypothetical protein
MSKKRPYGAKREKTKTSGKIEEKIKNYGSTVYVFRLTDEGQKLCEENMSLDQAIKEKLLKIREQIKQEFDSKNPIEVESCGPAGNGTYTVKKNGRKFLVSTDEFSSIKPAVKKQ